MDIAAPVDMTGGAPGRRKEMHMDLVYIGLGLALFGASALATTYFLDRR